MVRQMYYAVLVAAVVLIAALIYIELPGLPGEQGGAASSTSSVQLKEQVVQVVVADTPTSREQGLSGWEELPEKTGMLFVFEEDGHHSFWMKDMRFAIDIVWISHDGSIVHFEENAAPESYPAVFTPREKARYVLELPAGWVRMYDVRVGDIVRL